jgi:hypothetical protein
VSTQLSAAPKPPLFSLMCMEKTPMEPRCIAEILAFLAARRRDNSE